MSPNLSSKMTSCLPKCPPKLIWEDVLPNLGGKWQPCFNGKKMNNVAYYTAIIGVGWAWLHRRRHKNAHFSTLGLPVSKPGLKEGPEIRPVGQNPHSKAWDGWNPLLYQDQAGNGN